MYICWCVAEINYKMHGATVKKKTQFLFLGGTIIVHVLNLVYGSCFFFEEHDTIFSTPYNSE